MHMEPIPNRYLTLALVATIIGLTILPLVGALGGTPGTLGCTITHTANGQVDYGFSIPNRHIGADNAIYIPVRTLDKVAPLDRFTSIYKYSANCGLLWTATSSICTDTVAADICDFNSVQLDHAGRVLATVFYTPGTTSITQTYIEVRSAATGVLITRSFDLAALSPAWNDIRGAVSVKNGTDDVNYIAIDASADRVARFNRQLTTTLYNVPITNPAHIYCCAAFGSENHVIVGSTPAGAQANWNKVNASTGAVEASGQSGIRNTAIDERTPVVSYINSSLAYGAISGGASAATELSYRSVTTAGWSISAETDFTPAQIDESGLRDTDSQMYDLDGSDNLLICGTYTVGAESRGFWGHFKTSNNTMHWNTTLDAGDSTIVNLCALDFSGNFWLGITVTVGTLQSVQIRHYNGGQFSAISERRSTIVLAEDITDDGTAIDKLIDFPSQQWGFDFGPIFAAIIIGVIVVGTARATRMILAVAIVAIVSIIVVIKIESFSVPEWVLFIIVLVIAAVAGNRLFPGEDD